MSVLRFVCACSHSVTLHLETGTLFMEQFVAVVPLPPVYELIILTSVQELGKRIFQSFYPP